MIFRLKNFHSAGKVPCDGVASSIPPGKFFATASQAFCRLESSLRRRRRHSATRKVLCDGIAGILPRGKFFATASQAFCHAAWNLSFLVSLRKLPIFFQKQALRLYFFQIISVAPWKSPPRRPRNSKSRGAANYIWALDGVGVDVIWENEIIKISTDGCKSVWIIRFINTLNNTY